MSAESRNISFSEGKSSEGSTRGGMVASSFRERVTQRAKARLSSTLIPVQFHSSKSSRRMGVGGKITGFKEATFIEGKLVRIAKGKIEVESEDDGTGEPALLTLKLGDVDIDLDTIGEDVRVVIVDGKVARITRLSPKSVEKSHQELYGVSGSPRDAGSGLAG